jgi:hypothetical protein
MIAGHTIRTIIVQDIFLFECALNLRAMVKVSEGG